MGDSTECVKHIELYVNSSATSLQQEASVNAIATLLKNDMLNIETLVREMEMYLTTTDHIIRSRGILLLAEVLAKLTSKPLTDTSIHSLIGFFSERLADWKASRGAIVGCLALLGRKKEVGMVTDSEAKAVALSYLQNLQVQALGQHDRKLSFRLMECILDDYACAIRDLGDVLLYGICEAIDEEKDPDCLVLVFHIIESLAKLYPDPSGPLSKFAQDLFEILGSYFPIHFTHRKGEDDDNKREELSRALLLAFASTPLFEPFSMPLLLEKLSSSLPSAKVESFRYISYCTTQYGSERMVKYAQALWSSVKEATFISPQSTVSAESELMGGMGFQDNDMMTQAFVLLQEVMQQDIIFTNLVLSDKDINIFVNSLIESADFGDISLLLRQKLHAAGHILSVCAKSSAASCNKVFESYFPLLMNALGISPAKPSQKSYLDDDCSLFKLNFGALYLCTEFLGACRCLTVSFDNFTLVSDFANQTWCAMLHRFSGPLMKGFISFLGSNIVDGGHNAFVYLCVKGLQTLSTFPESFVPVSKPLYDCSLLMLVSIVTSEINKTFSWTSALKALVEIGLFIDKCPDSGRASSYKSTVVEKIVFLISSGDITTSSSLKLQAAYDIGATRKEFMVRIVQGLDEAIAVHFSAAYELGNLESDKLATKLLDTYSNKVLPWFLETGDSEEIPIKFALGIWANIENSRCINPRPPNNASNLLGATMTAMKKAVGCCTVEGQEMIINKSYELLLESNCFESMGFQSDNCSSKLKGLQQNHNFGSSTYRYEWLISLFASVVIALRPQTCIPNGKMMVQLFISAILNGHVSSAHALSALVNKLPSKITGINSFRSISLEEVLDMIFGSFFRTSSNGSMSGNDGHEINFSGLKLDTLRIQSAKSNVVIGLAWIGKALLMRGHVKVKDITMTLLDLLMLDGNIGDSNQLQEWTEVCDEEYVPQLMKCAADSFHIIMSDSEECLNRRYHAVIRPLYKQRFFSSVIPILSSLVVKSESSSVRSMLYRAFAHVVSDAPLTAILSEAKKLIPILLDCLSILSMDVLDKDIIYNMLLVVSGLLTDRNGEEVVIGNAPRIINQLIDLTAYSQSMAIRETAIQCLVAMSELPHTRIYPLKTQVLQSISKALDDPKRIIRQEAVRCRSAWASV
ncbi:MMS19 nucleotide excision repair protein homolog isoform X2 [Primulina huaijiensis]|uniref:MMS19 nucleotide excision repair protein homolog isoform X2 n=2 Tax=Primulina huaijiensis TaxID=1492673 RepID=UPI003CC71E13